MFGAESIMVSKNRYDLIPYGALDINFFFFFFFGLFVFLPFLGLFLWHMEVPRLGVELEL